MLFGGSCSTKADVDMTGTFLVFPGQTLTPNIGGAVSLTNPLVDLCYYSTTSITRKIGLKITKPGLAGSSSCPVVLAPDPQVGTAQMPTSTTAFTTISTDPFQFGAVIP